MRVLVLGSYPTAWPIHGGQIRLSEIVAAYRARGFEVREANVYPAHPLYRSTGRLRSMFRRVALDFALPADRLQSWRGVRAPLIEDLASGELVAGDEAVLGAIERHCGSVTCVHLEQPWLLPVVRRLRERGALGDFRLVYGAQNIEHELKRAILRQYRVEAAEPLVEAIAGLERDAAREADLVAAVTREDADWLAQWSRAQVVLAPNGVKPWRGSPRALARWRARIGSDPVALYVASAHPPNVTGYCESFGESLAGLSPVQRVAIAGSVVQHILESDWYRRWEPLNARRTVALGVLDSGDLDAVKDLAHTFVLPVTAGGGSNLKTAEALWSGRNVVATPFAMRGFEHLSDLPGLAIAQPGAEFARAVSHSLSAPLAAADPAADARRESLVWARTLERLVEAVEAIGGRA